MSFFSFIWSSKRTPQKKTPHVEKRSPSLVPLGKVVELTRGGPDGQWLDGNTGTNPMRFKK